MQKSAAYIALFLGAFTSCSHQKYNAPIFYPEIGPYGALTSYYYGEKGGPTYSEAEIAYENSYVKRHNAKVRWYLNEPRYIKESTKWLKRFYADLYACGGNMQAVTQKYGKHIDSVLRPTLTAAYENEHGGASGLDWSLFCFNVKDSTEASQIEISYSKNRWFNVRLVRKDTLALKVRIEDSRPKVLINGLLNPQRNIIMTPLDRMKIQALVRLYGDLGRCSDAEFTEKYSITFAPEVLDTLRHGDRYDWDRLKIGKEKFTAIRDEDVTYLGDDWFFIAPQRRKAGFIVLQVKVAGLKFKVTGIKTAQLQ